MSLESALRKGTFSLAAGLSLIAGGTLPRHSALAQESRQTTPSLYSLLLSHNFEERVRAHTEIFRSIQGQTTEYKMKQEAGRHIDELQKLADAERLGVPASFFAAEKRRVREVEPKKFTWAASFNDALWKQEVQHPVDTTVCRVLQRLEEKWLEGHGVKTPKGMVLIPAESFLMGSGYREAQYFEALTDSVILPRIKEPNPGKPDFIRYNDRRGYIAESPRRETDVRASFWMDIHEVTNADWAAYCKSSGITVGFTREKLVGAGMGEEWDTPTIPQKGKELRPFPFASKLSAASYAAKHGKRLPTEAEWEYAARGLGGAIWPWGNTPDISRGNFYENRDPRTIEKDRLSDVGSSPTGISPFGCLDMAGNIGEWTGQVLRIAVTGGWNDAEKTTDRREVPGFGVIKGASWNNSKNLSEYRCARGAPMQENGAYKVGFRCAQTIPPEHQYLSQPKK